MNLIPNLQYNSFSSVGVILRWNYITDAQNYKIYRMLYTDGSVIPTPGENNLITTLPGGTIKYIDSNIITNQSYVYFIRSITTVENNLSNGTIINWCPPVKICKNFNLIKNTGSLNSNSNMSGRMRYAKRISGNLKSSFR
tara:strand:- start:1557 stop:1976 length:420 start_codon:yes stop_codon:yes gene_type:complete